jgi:hypothetical protein
MIRNHSVGTRQGARPPRRWRRWGVLTVLFLAGVFSAWRGLKLSAAPQEPEIVAAIVRGHGEVRFEDEVEAGFQHAPFRDNENDKTVVSVIFREAHTSQTILAELVRLPKLTELHVSTVDSRDLELIGRLSGLKKLSFGSEVSEGLDLKPLTQLPNLSSLEVRAAPLDERAMEEIGKIHSLEKLVLCGTGATDAGLKALENLASLKDLLIWSRDITDEGLKCLGSMTQLTSLNISGHSLTNAGLKNLESLPNLKEFHIAGDNISRTAAGELRKKLVSQAAGED